MFSNHRASMSVEDGSAVKRETLLLSRPVRLGRHPKNEVVLDDGTVSREHAVILSIPSGFVLRDLNSTNGTRVNGSRLGRWDYLLRSGDTITLGGSKVELVFYQLAAGVARMEWSVDRRPGQVRLGEPTPATG